MSAPGHGSSPGRRLRVSIRAVFQIRYLLLSEIRRLLDYSTRFFRVPSIGGANISIAFLSMARPMGFAVWAASSLRTMLDGCHFPAQNERLQDDLALIVDLLERLEHLFPRRKPVPGGLRLFSPT